MSSFMTPMRATSFSSNMTGSSNNNTPAPLIRVPNGSTYTPSVLTNRQVSCDDSLYYMCLSLMSSLTKIPGMMPYIEMAHDQAEIASEQQALSIGNTNNPSHAFTDYGNVPSGRSTPTNTNQSSNGLSKEQKLSDYNENTTLHSSSSHRLSHGSILSNWNNTLYTFATGLLPAQIEYDPVTPISKLFRQGTPLCLIFNALKPENAIDIVSSDDLKVCKMNIYQFLSACKLHLSIKDDELFPITMVFSDNTTHLLRVIKSVEFVLNLQPSFATPRIPDQIRITDSRSKIVKELVETERRFVQDLEILVDYRNDLIASECIGSEDINMLFPNLNEIIDFQRKFLIGLECNAIVPNKYQRIGSIFIHVGVEGFKIYESWSLYQSFAIDLIEREANKLRNISKVIKDPYDLQNFFLIKPIQRLTKYPLLLSQLLKESDQSWPNYTELHQAYLISKEVALGINESQRKSENVHHLNDLKEKVVDWKGYTTKNVGELLYFNVVTVKDLLTDGHSNEKEVHCYLFEKVIYFFKEVSQKNKILGSKKMSNLSFTNASNISTILNQVQLSLNGIVYINKIYKILASDASPYFANPQGHFLTLRWKGNKDTGGCIVKFRSEENLNQWNNTIRRLSAESGVDDFYGVHNSTKSMSSISSSGSLLTDTNRSSSTSAAFSNGNNRNSDRLRSSSDSNAFMKKLRSTSSSSFTNLNLTYPPLPTEKTLRSMSISSSSNNNNNNNNSLNNLKHNRTSSTASGFNTEEIVSNMSNLTISNSGSIVSQDMTNIKLVFKDDKPSINLSVNSDISYDKLVELLVNKINYNLGDENRFTPSNATFKFKDEDGDNIRFHGDDDWEIAKEMLQEQDADSRILQLLVSC